MWRPFSCNTYSKLQQHSWCITLLCSNFTNSFWNCKQATVAVIWAVKQLNSIIHEPFNIKGEIKSKIQQQHIPALKLSSSPLTEPSTQQSSPSSFKNILPARQVTARYVVNTKKGMCLYVSVYVCETTAAKVGQCVGQPELTGVVTEGGRKQWREGARGRTLAAMWMRRSVAACSYWKRVSCALTSSTEPHTCTHTDAWHWQHSCSYITSRKSKIPDLNRKGFSFLAQCPFMGKKTEKFPACLCSVPVSKKLRSTISSHIRQFCREEDF